MVSIRPDEISAILKKQIEDYDKSVSVSNVGTVLTVGDGIARVYGLQQAMAGELIEFEDGTEGIALNLEDDNVGAVLMGEGYGIQEGSTVKATGKIAAVPVGEAMLGRVVNSLGRAIDGKGEIATSETRLIESMAPGIIQRKSVHEPMQTGITAIDAMIPVGRPARESISDVLASRRWRGGTAADMVLAPLLVSNAGARKPSRWLSLKEAVGMDQKSQRAAPDDR